MAPVFTTETVSGLELVAASALPLATVPSAATLVPRAPTAVFNDPSSCFFRRISASSFCKRWSGREAIDTARDRTV